MVSVVARFVITVRSWRASSSGFGPVFRGVICRLSSGRGRRCGSVTAELAVTLPHRLPRPELSRQITPRNTGPKPEDDALHDLTVITKRATTLTMRRRHQRLN